MVPTTTERLESDGPRSTPATHGNGVSALDLALDCFPSFVITSPVSWKVEKQTLFESFTI